MYIIKRNNQKVEFDKQKIINAINKAFLEVDGEIFETDIANDIADKAELLVKHTWEETPYTVEDIQDFIEDELMATYRKDVARAYVRFRYKKEVIRNHKDDFIKAYEEKIGGKAIQNQNANVDEQSFGGRKGEAASAVDKQYALDYMMSDLARERHLNNQIYTHDLDSYSVGMHNCLSIPFDDLLANGFNTRQTDVRTANSVNTAMQLVAVIFQLQSLQQFGGVAATHLDWTMVPYVRKSFYKYWKKGLKYLKHNVLESLSTELKEKTLKNFNAELPIDDKIYKNPVFADVYNFAMDMLFDEIHQAVEGLYHNLNTLQSRSGNQLPFTSINYGTCTLPEGRMIIDALLEVSIKGLGKLHKTSVFPCGIFQLMRGVNRRPGDPNYDLFRKALRSTAQRLYPNYANCDWSNAAGYDINDPRTYFSTMGKCKLQLI